MSVLLETVQLLRKIQSEVNFLRSIEKKEKEKRRTFAPLPSLSICSLPEHQQFRSFYHSLPGSVVIISAGGEILDANEHFCQCLRLRRNQVLSNSLFAFAHSSTLLFLYTSISHLMTSTSSIFRAIHLFVHKGEMVPHVVSISSIKSERSIVFSVAFTPLIHLGSPICMCPTSE